MELIGDEREFIGHLKELAQGYKQLESHERRVVLCQLVDSALDLIQHLSTANPHETAQLEAYSHRSRISRESV